MLLKDRLHHQGNTLFRLRSFIPLILLPAVLASLPYFGFMESAFGEDEAFGYWLRTDTHWALIFAVGVVLFFTLRTLKKHIRLLREPQADVSRMAAPRDVS